MNGLSALSGEGGSNKKESQVAQFERLWTGFETFFQSVIANDRKALKEAQKKHKNLLYAP
jgi:hypothetical protein